MNYRIVFISIASLTFLAMGFKFMDVRPESNNQTMEDAPILGLRTCVYMVPDLDEAKKWYAAAFQQEPYFEESFYVGFNIGGFELGLQPSDKATSEKSKSVYTYWGVEDVKAQYQRLISLGAEADEEPNNVGSEIIVASVKDPWGNIIGLIYNPHFK